MTHEIFPREASPRRLYRWIPLLAVLRAYKLSWLPRDVAAALVLTAMLVPVGMGYAQAAGLPAIYGLYATIVPLIVYAIFGPSRVMILGPDSALAALIAATILPLAAGDEGKAVALAGLLAIVTGFLCVAAGAARFGFITELLSKPIRYGYLNGIALTVMISQLPKVFGFSVNGGSFLQEIRLIAEGMLTGKINWMAFAIGFFCLVVIFGFRRWFSRIPGILIAVMVTATAVTCFDLSTTAGIAVVGPMPQGLPSFQIPEVSFSEFASLLAGAVAIALVAFADMSTLSRAFALRGGYEVDTDQEMIALGAANIASGFFQGFPVTSSASRTPVAQSAGAQTQITGLTAALCIALLLVLAPSLLKNLPQAALGAIVIFACIGLVEIKSVARLYKLRRSEFALSIICFLGVLTFGVIKGIFIAVALALFAFIWRAWKPHSAVLGHVEGLKSYHDITRYPEARLINGLVLFRWDAPLFFANAETFREQVLRAVAQAPTPTRWVVVTAEPITDVDVTAADMLEDLDATLYAAGIELCFAEMKDPVKDKLKRYGLFTRFGADNFFPTIEHAVERYLSIHKEK